MRPVAERHVSVHLTSPPGNAGEAGDGGGNGEGGGGVTQRCCWRGPQSVQSVQMSQFANSAPGPPSSQLPSDKKNALHVLLQTRMSMPGVKGGGLGGGGLKVVGRAQRTQPPLTTEVSADQRMELPRGTCTFTGPVLMPLKRRKGKPFGL